LAGIGWWNWDISNQLLHSVDSKSETGAFIIHVMPAVTLDLMETWHGDRCKFLGLLFFFLWFFFTSDKVWLLVLLTTFGACVSVDKWRRELNPKEEADPDFPANTEHCAPQLGRVLPARLYPSVPSKTPTPLGWHGFPQFLAFSSRQIPSTG
jgi:hypothetical protein